MINYQKRRPDLLWWRGRACGNLAWAGADCIRSKQSITTRPPPALKQPSHDSLPAQLAVQTRVGVLWRKQTAPRMAA